MRFSRMRRSMYIRPPVTPGSAKRVASSAKLDVRIWRGGDAGSFAAYEVPVAENQTVLDIVTWVQRHLEPALAYRFACRVGVCGSCAMTVNGRARWTCRSHVKDVAGGGRLVHRTAAQPAPHQGPGVRSRAVLRQVAARGRTFRRQARTRHDPMPAVDPTTDGCGGARWTPVSSASTARCATAPATWSGWRPDYLGPAALNRAWTLGQRRASRRDPRRSLTSDDGRRRLHRLPHARKLHRTLPGGDQSHRGHRRAEAPDLPPMAAGTTRMSSPAPHANSPVPCMVWRPVAELDRWYPPRLPATKFA